MRSHPIRKRIHRNIQSMKRTPGDTGSPSGDVGTYRPSESRSRMADNRRISPSSKKPVRVVRLRPASPRCPPRSLAMMIYVQLLVSADAKWSPVI